MHKFIITSKWGVLIIMAAALVLCGCNSRVGNRIVKVACIGDEITFGKGLPDRNSQSWPAQLGQMMGQEYEVRNFTLEGATVSDIGKNQYIKSRVFESSIEWNPDIVIIMMGTNDSAYAENWVSAQVLFSDGYRELIARYKALPSNPEIYLAACPYTTLEPEGNTGGIRNSYIAYRIDSEILKIAKDEDCTFINTYPSLEGVNKLLADGINPNSEGSTVIADEIYGGITDCTGKAQVALIGDSITYGYGDDKGGLPGVTGYPAQLRKMLDPDKFVVRNFGVSGRTLSYNGDFPYVKEQPYRDSLEWQPDIIVIMLGTNDVKPQNYVHKGEFVSDYRKLIESYKNLSAKPAVYVCTSPCLYANSGEWSPERLKEIVSMTKQAANAEKCDIIDVYSATRGMPASFPDGIHPNRNGAAAIARVISGKLIEK